MSQTFSLRAAIHATVCWFDVFGQAVTLAEIQRFLFFRKATLTEVKAALAHDARITQKFGLYFLRGRAAIVPRRARRKPRIDKLWQRVSAYRFLFCVTPFVRLAAITNTLAMGWPTRDSDIDLFIVAKSQRLFTARLLLTLLVQIFGVRRHDRKIAGRFCLSFFVDEINLDLEKLQIGSTDPYLAFWVATITPIAGSAAADFFARNGWVKKYFPNWQPARFQRKTFLNFSFVEKIFALKIFDPLENFLKKWQLARARSSRQRRSMRTAVVITPTILKFHETDRRREFLAQWRARLKSGSKKAKK